MFRLSFIILFIFCAFSQQPNNAVFKRTVSVQGSAEMLIEPDIIIWNASIESIEYELEASRKKVDRVFNAVKSQLVKAGIKSTDIKLSGNSQNKQYEYDNGKRRFKGFRTQVQLEIKARKLDLYQDVNDILLIAEEIQVSNTVFDSSEKQKYENQILEAAAKDAKQKATLLAKSFSMKLGKPISIEIHQTTSPILYARGGRMKEASIMMDSSVDVTDHAGKISVSRSVHFVFELVD
jgi:hypothetical protein